MNIIFKLPKFLKGVLYHIIPRVSNRYSVLSILKEAFRISLFPKEEFYGNM
jgi:hypothetical protein